ncbi:MAG: hypothetical protein H7338_14665 [Candidatus Sericytochromatia bacterium]|nr:hypothetical protein [Candidatus Sericytochromatia bacterium]
MFLRIGDQQFGWIKGGFFAVGRTPFRPPLGSYAQQTEVGFLERYARQLELELTDVDKRLGMLHDTKGAPTIEPQTARQRESVAG